MKDLAQSLTGILQAMQDALEAARATDEPLAEVAEVVRGDRSRPTPKMPAIWLVPDRASFVQESYGHETWQLPVVLAAMVKNADPVAGAETSQRLAAIARSVVLGSHELLGADIALTDITSQTFDPTAHSSEQNRTLFWTEATVLVTFDCTS